MIGSPDMYVLMIRGDVEVCCMGIFSTAARAIEHAQLLGNGREVWVEKFKPDQPSHYEDQDEYIVWKNTRVK
jgi:hypothetical protein